MPSRTIKKKLRKLVAALDPKDEAKLLVANISDDLKEIEKKIVPQKDYSPVIQSLRNELIGRILELPSTDELEYLRSEFETKIKNLEKETVEPIQEQMQDIVSNDITTDETLREDLEEKIKKVRAEFLNRLNNIGGGSQNQRIQVNGTTMSKKYADFNLIGSSVSAADNNTTKQVDITFTGGGGSPGGSDTQVQFNDGGSFGGDAGLTFDKTNDILTADRIVINNVGNDTNPFVIKTNGSVGNYTPTNSGIFIKDAGGTEILRIWASDPVASAGNFFNLYIGAESGLNQPTTDAGTSGSQNVGIGFQTLKNIAAGTQNAAIGYQTMLANTDGTANMALGSQALVNNLTGSNNMAIGVAAFSALTSGGDNVGIGTIAGQNFTTANQAIFIGSLSGAGASPQTQTITGAVGIGYQSGAVLVTGSDYNIMIGWQSGYEATGGTGISSGARNILIGASTIDASGGQVTTGSRNISIGDDVAVPSKTASNQLCIANFIYGTGLDGTGATISSGKLGIGNTAPVEFFSVGTNSEFQLNISGLNKKYNGIATVSNGIPSELATIDSTGLTANVGASTLYSVPASGAGMYRVSAYLVTTTAASVSSTMPNAQVVYTDKDSNTSVTLDVSPILGAAGLGQSGLLTANTVGTVFSGTVVVYIKASTTIQYQTVNYASTAAGMAYALHMKLEALG